MPSRVMKSVWLTWEHVFHKVWHVKPIEPGQRHLFYVSYQHYLGKPFEVDGIRVNRFDPVVELHMNNDLLMETIRDHTSIVGLAARLLIEAKRSLPALAEHVNRERYGPAQVLFGVTFIHRGVERLGFHSFPIRRKWMLLLTQWHLKNVFKMVNPKAEELLGQTPDLFVPRVVAISKERFLSTYLTSPSDRQKRNHIQRDHALT